MSIRKTAVLIVVFLGFSLMTVSASADPIIIKWGDAAPKSYSYYPAMEAFKAEVEKKTNGKVQFQLYGDGVLGDQRTLIESTRMGSVQMASTSTLTIESFIPEHLAVGLPFIWPSRQRFIEFLASDEYKKFGKLYEEKGLKLIAWSYLGEYAIMNNKHEIKVPKDMSGLKIRVVPTPLMIDVFKALGASPVAMSHTEVYSAVQQGVLDGVSTASQFLYSMKIQEVAKYYTDVPGMRIGLANVVVNLKFWNSLPPDIQKVFIESSGTWDKANADYYFDVSRETSNAKIKERFESQGVKCALGDYDAFKKLSKPVTLKYRNKIGPEIVDPVLKFAGYTLD